MRYILVVDDCEDGRDALCGYLVKQGFEVDFVLNGREALSSILARVPDLVILDFLMPEMDGVGFLRVVRSYLRLQDLPVVVLTAISDQAMMQQARDLKVDAILLKTESTLADIVETVRQQLSHGAGKSANPSPGQLHSHTPR